ncbi:hypothetical protein JN531_017015 (plasmid) [Flagellatimonas centrodinii]|uniref:hypothetical protein n=1 Tax=Flagellatimonas centrodinii TaxID=2806210 RepID=UPI001FEECBDB|nr:hypothetical protein [Flagellatimonas centrodinii]ULQ48334.1 hypothetical protein JN531_017015 [Flagellatimonas centrodinii]
MVHSVKGTAISILAAAGLVSGCATRGDSGFADDYRKAQIRQTAMRSIVARPAADGELREKPLISGPLNPSTTGPHTAPMILPPPVSARLTAMMKVSELVTLWGMSIGYTPVITSKAAGEAILGSFAEVDFTEVDMGGWMARNVGVRIDLIPEVRMILVSRIQA